MSIVLAPSSSGVESFAWIDQRGVRHSLSEGPAGNYQEALGKRGLWAPPLRAVREQLALEHGSRLRSIRSSERGVDLPILVRGDSRAAWFDLFRDLVDWFWTDSADGILERVAPDGAARWLYCRYEDGLDSDPSGNDGAVQWNLVVVGLTVGDVFWYDAEETTATYALDEDPAGFFDAPAFFPLRLAGSTIFREVAIDNDGTVETWPVWTLTGPGANPVIRNSTTGLAITIAETLLAGEQIVIDTRPGAKTVTDGLGGNLFGSLTNDSALWPLVRGTNQIQIEFGGATTASSVAISWRRRWLTP